MGDMIKRQKIVERDHFTYEEKLKFAAKSDNKCCFCGKKVFINYGATVEHFIPLSQGGTNRDINMVMLCKDCNEKKGSFIYNPDDYLIYLKDEHKEKIKGYFDSYIKSFDFINRDNLLACDRYKVLMSPMTVNLWHTVHTNKNKRGKKIKETLKNNATTLWVKRATYEDIDKLTEYFIKYLKKYNALDSEKDARINIEFWMTFGCIYYIETSNEIKCFVTVSVTKANDHVFLRDEAVDSFLTINIFSYYSTDNALIIAYNLAREVPKRLYVEQKLQQVPVKFCILKKDKLCYELCEGGAIYEGGNFMESFMIFYDNEDVKNLPKISEDESLSKFFNRFAEVNQQRIDDWFKTHNTETFSWMVRELMLKSDEEDNWVTEKGCTE